MCGFAGFADWKQQSNEDVLRKMTGTLHHRGPDDSGFAGLSFPGLQMGMGFRRLSIIDLSPGGHQPMEEADAGVTLTFNGEIYNYLEIRKELELLGHSFRSHSDTEVILKSYLQWGIGCLSRFNGMFAIALSDLKRGKLYLIRDRVGIKPLYYAQADRLLLWGSELKALRAHPGFSAQLNPDALSLYFQFGYIPAPHCIYRNTFKLDPGHYLEVDLHSGSTALHCWWSLQSAYQAQPFPGSYEEAQDSLQSLLRSAFQYRMIADVPVGVFLSGGYDSTAVAAILREGGQPLQTFTIGFEEKAYNESIHAEAVARHLGTHHENLYCTPAEASGLLSEWADIYDEPFGDTSGIPTTLVSRMARKKVTVALSADGGDELFGGYPRFLHAQKRMAQLDKWPAGLLSGLAEVMLRLNSAAAGTDDKWAKLAEYGKARGWSEKYLIVSKAMSSAEAGRLLKESTVTLPLAASMLKLPTRDPFAHFMAADYRQYLSDDIMQKVDRASMHCSLEGREPFLDYRILEFAASLPMEFKIYEGRGKRILKDLVHRYVPADLMERPKMGFGIPLERWLRNEYRGEWERISSPEFIKRQNVFNPETISEMKERFENSRPIDLQRIGFFFLFQLWWEKWG